MDVFVEVMKIMAGVILMTIVLNWIFPPPKDIHAFMKEEDKKCPLHKWEYVNNHLVCEWCKKTPEEVCLSIF